MASNRDDKHVGHKGVIQTEDDPLRAVNPRDDFTTKRVAPGIAMGF